jgi:phospholipase/carboxylesterase
MKKQTNRRNMLNMRKQTNGRNMLNFTHRPAKSGRDRFMLFLLHGFQSNGEDMLELVDYLSGISDDLGFIAPDAPEKAGWGDGFQWFPLDMWDLTPVTVAQVITKNQKVFQSFLEKQVKKLSLAWENVFLVGFSQGAMVALRTGVRLDHRIGGIVSFSGLQPDTTESLAAEGRGRQRVLLIHSPGDNIVPFIGLEYSRDLLKEFGSEVTTYESRGDLRHSVDEDCVAVARNFISEILENRKGETV